MNHSIVLTDFGGPHNAPILVVGPSLGTSVRALWAAAAASLSERLRVIGWDLPGHGHSPTGAPFSVADLAAAVLSATEAITGGAPFHYAGDSVGGAVGLQLLLDVPDRLATATLLCTGARIGDAEHWRSRAALARSSGTHALVPTATQRWFAPGFVQRQPDIAAALLNALRETDAEGYAQTCEALGQFDVNSRLSEITTPVLAIAGAADVATPPESLQRIAEQVVAGRLVVLDGVGHLAPAEAPGRVADMISGHIGAIPASRYEAGMQVRRSVLGAEHVDRATASATTFTADFQTFITEYAWGSIWTRPGLDRRSRSLITLTALVARGHHEELAMHVVAARRNGLSADEIKETLLQCAIYCGVPDANTAFRIANGVLSDT